MCACLERVLKSPHDVLCRKAMYEVTYTPMAFPCNIYQPILTRSIPLSLESSEKMRKLCLKATRMAFHWAGYSTRPREWEDAAGQFDLVLRSFYLPFQSRPCTTRRPWTCRAKDAWGCHRAVDPAHGGCSASGCVQSSRFSCTRARDRGSSVLLCSKRK